MPTLPISSASINALYLPKPLRLATGKALLGIAIASILSTTAFAAEIDSRNVPQIAAQEIDEQQTMPSVELDTIVVKAAREELEQAAGLSVIRAC